MIYTNWNAINVLCWQGYKWHSDSYNIIFSIYIASRTPPSLSLFLCLSICACVCLCVCVCVCVWLRVKQFHAPAQAIQRCCSSAHRQQSCDGSSSMHASLPCSLAMHLCQLSHAERPRDALYHYRWIMNRTYMTANDLEMSCDVI